MMKSSFGSLIDWQDQLDRKSTRLNSSHTVIYTLSLHDALPILSGAKRARPELERLLESLRKNDEVIVWKLDRLARSTRSEEHTSELQSHRDLHSFPTRRSSDLIGRKTSTTRTGTPLRKSPKE